MQAPTYILSGMIARRSFYWRYFRFFSVLFTILTALLFHGVLDKLSKSVYDPPIVDFTDPVWLIWHIISWLSAIVMLYMFWREYKLGIIISLLPYIDWWMIHIPGAFGRELIFYKQPWIHVCINYFMDNVLPFSYLNQLPDHRNNPLACIWELLLFALMVLIFRWQTSTRRNIHF